MPTKPSMHRRLEARGSTQPVRRCECALAAQLLIKQKLAGALKDVHVRKRTSRLPPPACCSCDAVLILCVRGAHQLSSTLWLNVADASS
eukprot:5866934-Pleurochrysis_carterae.AAC.1